MSRRVNDLAKRHQTLADISLYTIVLYEGDPAANRLAQFFGISQKKAAERLAYSDIRSIETLTSAVRAFTSSLDDMLGFEVLDEPRAKLFFRSLLNPDAEHVGLFHSEPGDRLDYDMADTNIHVEHDQLRLNEYYVTAASVKLTPANPKPATIASALARVNCDFIACMEWKPQTTLHMRKLIKSRQKTFLAQGVSMFVAAFAGMWTSKFEMPPKKDLDEHVENLGECLVALERGFQFGAFSGVIALIGKDQLRVRNAFAELVRVYGQADASLVRETLNLYSAYLSIIPGNTQLNHSYSYLFSRDYANLAFAWQSWTGNRINKHLRDEYMCLYETRDQQLFYFNGHVGGTFGVLKTGAPESGKSFDTVYQIANLQKYDPVTLVLDIGGSYSDLTDYFDGRYFEVSKRNHRVRMNPFSLANTHENRQFLFAFLRLLLGKDPNQAPEKAAKDDRAIYEAIESVYELAPKDRRLGNVSLPAALQLRLQRWCEGGQYGHVFDNETDNIEFSHFQGFEFQGMEKEPDLLVPICFYVTQRFDQVVYDPTLAGQLKLLVIDEGWRWMLSGDMGPYMVDKLKTGRKYNLCNMFITQSGLDAERAGFGELLNEACPTKIFFANPEIRPESYQRLYGLNTKQAEQISQLKPREELAIFATDPARPAVKQFKVVRLKLDNAEDQLMCSNDPNANQIRLRRRVVTA
ncbi:MAG: hypothetical protein JOZ62_14420 [Acidobacteriaceae bacterium]|nr:hypothetical protein [Acidobacteriaceae bacterium]